MIAAAAVLILAASGAPAQDLPTTQLDDHAQVVRQDMLTRSLLRPRGRQTDVARQRAACAQKAKLRARYGGDNLDVRRLYNLCYKAGL